MNASRRTFVVASLVGVPAVALARFSPAQPQEDPLVTYLVGELHRNAQILRSVQRPRKRAQAGHAIAATTEALLVHAQAQGQLARLDAQRNQFTVEYLKAQWSKTGRRLQEEYDVAPLTLSPQTFDSAVRLIQRYGFTEISAHVRAPLDALADRVDDPTLAVFAPLSCGQPDPGRRAPAPRLVGVALRQDPGDFWRGYCEDMGCGPGDAEDMKTWCYLAGILAVVYAGAGAEPVAIALGLFVAVVCPFFPIA